jgi:hypothetical protein
VMYDPAAMQSHTITATGGQEKTSYLYSLNYYLIIIRE